MSCPELPVVVTIPPSQPVPRAARLADVLVVVTDQGEPARLCMELLECYPGLALTLVGTPAGEFTVGVRDGASVIRHDVVFSAEPDVAMLTAIANLLHVVWAAGNRLDQRSGS